MTIRISWGSGKLWGSGELGRKNSRQGPHQARRTDNSGKKNNMEQKKIEKTSAIKGRPQGTQKKDRNKTRRSKRRMNATPG